MSYFPVGELCCLYSLTANVTVHQVNLSLYNTKESAIGKKKNKVANGRTTNQTATDD